MTQGAAGDGKLRLPLLALAGKIAGKLEMPPARQKWTGIASVVLLSAGILLYITPLRPQELPEETSESTILAAATQPALMVQLPSTHNASKSASKVA